MISTLYDGVRDQVDRAVELLSPAVQPVFGLPGDSLRGCASGTALESTGSAVLLNAAGQHALVSAAHAQHDGGYVALVKKGHPSGVSYVGGSEAEFIRFRPPIVHKSLDIGCVKLEAGQVARLVPEPLFLTESHILKVTPPNVRHYLVLGYPGSLQQTDFASVYRTQPHGFPAVEATEAYRELTHKGVTQSTHLLLRIDPTISEYWRERIVLTGISGGGLWLLGDVLRRVAPDNLPPLVGIITDYFLEPTPILAAVRINAVIELLTG